MLFGIIGGIIFCIALSVEEKLNKKEELIAAQEGNYELYFSR